MALDKVVRPDLFSGCTTPEEVRARFKTLAKTMHPDAGGSHEKFLELTRARDAAGAPETLADFFAGLKD